MVIPTAGSSMVKKGRGGQRDLALPCFEKSRRSAAFLMLTIRLTVPVLLLASRFSMGPSAVVQVFPWKRSPICARVSIRADSRLIYIVHIRLRDFGLGDNSWRVVVESFEELRFLFSFNSYKNLNNFSLRRIGTN